MNDFGTKTLFTERLILRKFENEDLLSIFHNWLSDEKMTVYLGWKAHNNLDETKRILSIWLDQYKDGAYNWNIILKETGESIGNISVINYKKMLEENNAYMYYCIGSNYWKKGYATEALREVIHYLSNEVGIEQISAGFDSLNVASGKVLEKAGMDKINILENMGFNPNTGMYDTDRVEYSIRKR